MRRTALLLVAVLAAAGCGGEDEPERTQPQAQAPAATATPDHPGLKVWAAMGCGSCHKLEEAGSTATIGPPLDRALKTRDRAYITEKIVSPPAGSIMPEDFGERMTDRQLEDLVNFIYESAN